MYGLPIAETSHCHPVLFAKVRSPERFLSKHVASCILVFDSHRTGGPLWTLVFYRRRGHWLYADVRRRAPRLITLLSSLPLARAHHRSNPAFDLHHAYRRIIRTFWTSLLIMIFVTALVIHLTPFLVTVGYFFGMILALLRSIRRMSPIMNATRLILLPLRRLLSP